MKSARWLPMQQQIKYNRVIPNNLMAMAMKSGGREMLRGAVCLAAQRVATLPGEPSFAGGGLRGEASYRLLQYLHLPTYSSLQ